MDNAENEKGLNRRYRHGSSDEIKADIDKTRGRMDETLDALSERLTPRHLLDDLLDMWRRRRSPGDGKVRNKAHEIKERAGDTAHRAGQGAAAATRLLGRQIAEHPIPSLLFGAGLAWMLVERHRKDEEAIRWQEDDEMAEAILYYGPVEGFPDESAGDFYNEADDQAVFWAEQEEYSPALPIHYQNIEPDEPDGKFNQLKEKMSATTQSVKAAATGAAHEVKMKTTEMRERARVGARNARYRSKELSQRVRGGMRRGYHRTSDSFGELVEDHPLAVGVGFLALGTLVGLALPRTDHEDEWMGERSDELRRRGSLRARQAYQQGKEAVGAVAHTAKEEAEKQGLTPSHLKESAQHVADAVKEKSKDEASSRSETLSKNG